MGIFFRKNTDDFDGWAIDRPAKQKGEIKTINNHSTLYMFVGNERCDYLYYLVKIGLMANKHILVVDNSVEHNFFNAVSKDDGETIAKTDNLVVCCDYRITREQMDQYFEIIYVWLGHNYKGISDYIADTTIYLTSPEAGEIRIAKMAYEQTKEINAMKRIYILRDQYSRKITAQSAKMLCNMTTDETYEVIFSEGDYASYVSFTHNGSAYLKFLSSDLKALLTELSMEIYDLPQKKIKRMLK